MKTKFKLIAGVLAAAALSTGITAYAAANPEPAAAVSSAWKAVSFAERLSAVTNYRENNELSLFEKGLFDDVYGCRSNHRAENKKDKNGFVWIVLKPVLERGSDDFSLCAGCFYMDDPASFSCAFDEAETFKCVVGEIGSITAKDGFENNYKSIHVVNTYLENGQLVYKGASVSGDDPALSVFVNYGGSGKLVESKYFFCLYEGGEGSPCRDTAVVHLIERDFRDSELYKGISE